MIRAGSNSSSVGVWLSLRAFEVVEVPPLVRLCCHVLIVCL